MVLVCVCGAGMRVLWCWYEGAVVLVLVYKSLVPTASKWSILDFLF